MAKAKAVRRPTKPPVPATKVVCAAGVCDPERTQGLQAQVAQGTHELVTLKGPGVFVAAEVSKQGGSNDITFVILDIDGRSVTNLSYAAAANLGLTQHNPYGLVLLQGSGIKTMTIGFPTPLLYKRSLRLAVTVNEAGVQQIVANVVHGGA
jgi:hypothetical protein